MVLIGNRKDILELDELSDDCLKANFGAPEDGHWVGDYDRCLCRSCGPVGWIE